MRGLGLDLVEIPRFRALCARRPALLARLFTGAERAALAGRADPVPGLAARFAAKEAAMKALGVGLGALDWHDLEVVSLASGAPELRWGGRALALATERQVAGVHLSLSHTDATAAAVVVLD